MYFRRRKKMMEQKEALYSKELIRIKIFPNQRKMGIFKKKGPTKYQAEVLRNITCLDTS